MNFASDNAYDRRFSSENTMSEEEVASYQRRVCMPSGRKTVVEFNNIPKAAEREASLVIKDMLLLESKLKEMGLIESIALGSAEPNDHISANYSSLGESFLYLSEQQKSVYFRDSFTENSALHNKGTGKDSNNSTCKSHLMTLTADSNNVTKFFSSTKSTTIKPRPKSAKVVCFLFVFRSIFRIFQRKSQSL